MGTLKLKKFLNILGSQPGNYDKETQEWIASTPPDKLRRELQNYQAEVGVDFYNLDLSNVVFPKTGEPGEGEYTYRVGEDGKVLREFYLKHIGGPIDAVSVLPKTKGMPIHLEEGIFVSILSYAPQPTYKTIVDKAIAGEKMTEDEIRCINEGRKGYETYQEYVKEKGRYELRTRVYFGHYGIIKALYEFVYDVSCQRVKVGKCAFEGCDRIFTIGGPGKAQKYCSETHRVRAYQLRKAGNG